MTDLTIRTTSLRSPRLIPAAIVAFWLAGILTLAAKGAFVAATGGLPVGIMLAVPFPPLLFLLAYATLRPVRDWVAGLDLGLVVGVQIWRVLGGSFLILWWLELLPAVFAIPAGAGDVAVGLLALFVTRSVLLRTDGWRRRAGWLIVAGMADFTIAVLTGILSDPGRILGFPGQPSGELMQMIPLVLIPAFLVPVFIIAHLIVWIRLRRV